MALSHLTGSTLRTRNECYYVLLMSCYYPPNAFVLGDVCFQIHSCEAYIFCRTGDFATGYNLFVYSDVRRGDPFKCDMAFTNFFGLTNHVYCISRLIGTCSFTDSLY